ncbi:MAG: DUF3305 domain-containing protein [Burkholderiaceae bacterium]
MSETPVDAPGRGAPLQDGPPLQATLPVTVLVRCTPTPSHRWQSHRYETIAVLPAQAAGDTPAQPSASSPGTGHDAETDRPRLVRHDGLEMRLYPDEAESYYLNLLTDSPRCFVIYKPDDADDRRPFLVTPSFDLATSYEGGDHPVEAVDLDPAFHRAIEAYVLNFHIPEQKRKRQRQDWKKIGQTP